MLQIYFFLMFPFLTLIKGNVSIISTISLYSTAPLPGVLSAVLLYNATTLESKQLWLNLYQTTFRETNQNPTFVRAAALPCISQRARSHLCVNSCLHLSGLFSLWHLKAFISSSAPDSRHVDLWTTIDLVSRGRQTRSPLKSIFTTNWIKGWNNRFHTREPPVAN